MANPIEPTPPLEGVSADELLDQLADVCPSDEAGRRVAAAQRLLTQVLIPKADDRVAAE